MQTPIEDVNQIPLLLERASKKMTSASANSAAWVLAGEFRDYLKNREPIRRKPYRLP